MERDLNFSHVLAHELSPQPVAIFDENGGLKVPKNKAALKQKLKVVVGPRRNTKVTYVIDASAMMWTLSWPKKGRVRDLIDIMSKELCKLLQEGNVYLVFERCYEMSIKAYTRMMRTETGTKLHKLNLNSPLPTQGLPDSL